MDLKDERMHTRAYDVPGASSQKIHKYLIKNT